MIYLRNAAAMWTALLPGSRLDERLLRVDRPGSTRVILRQPPTTQTVAEVAGMALQSRVVVEDVFTSPDAAPVFPNSRSVCMPVMDRPPGGLKAAAVPVVEVRDPDTLAAAEQVMVDGFPFPQLQPWARGQALPPRVLDLPGWRVWLAHDDDGSPAAAAYTFDDGHATGLYWLATLAQHRSRGLGRAVLSAAIAARPDQVFTLVATEAGRPLYESLGFAVVRMATWHTRPPILTA
ncbi:GNAT family N-acetyltransferase [Actinoplanes sp. CA-252034]|uniref:GNAT family N-acetyltransferase n=1 Tax=Actinoplanes sp. CA-252034 TaxID=3239906 RepID=UPI003D99224E